MCEIFCNAVKLWPVKVAWVDPLYRKDRWAGRLVNFKAYFCHHNKCYVVYSWREFDWPIPTQLTGQNAMQGNEVVTVSYNLVATSL